MDAIVCDGENCENWVANRDNAGGWVFGVFFGGDGADWSALGPYDFCSGEHMDGTRKDVFDSVKLEAVGE